MIIVGAGMAGLLAGGMIRDRPVTIYEAAPTLPNNHSAVLRFRSSVVGDTLGIEFKAVDMMKAVHPWRNAVADNLAYSLKCTATATLRSIVTAEGGIQRRFIAPGNLIELMAARLNGLIKFRESFNFNGFSGPFISTIPMPVLMDILEYRKKPKFKYVHGFNINGTLPGVDAYASVYVPDPEFPFNRISLTGDRLTIEISDPNNYIESADDIDCVQLVDVALSLLGLSTIQIWDFDFKTKPQKYAKILPINDDERKHFIMWATEKFGIYSLGRFATWRPGLLLDDLVNDVRVIQRMINKSASSYDHKKG